LLLTVTPCILLPAMVFLRLTAAGRSLWLRIITNAVFGLMALEVIVSVVHFVICKPGQKRSMTQTAEEDEYLPEEQPSAVGSPTSSEQKRRVRRSPESK